MAGGWDAAAALPADEACFWAERLVKDKQWANYHAALLVWAPIAGAAAASGGTPPDPPEPPEE